MSLNNIRSDFRREYIIPQKTKAISYILLSVSFLSPSCSRASLLWLFSLLLYQESSNNSQHEADNASLTRHRTLVKGASQFFYRASYAGANVFSGILWNNTTHLDTRCNSEASSRPCSAHYWAHRMQYMICVRRDLAWT